MAKRTGGIAAVVALALSMPSYAPTLADSYPNKPIRVVVPNPPGGVLDLGARRAQEGFSTAIGQPVVIDNRPGAGGNIAASRYLREIGVVRYEVDETGYAWRPMDRGVPIVRRRSSVHTKLRVTTDGSEPKLSRRLERLTTPARCGEPAARSFPASTRRSPR
jgi:hypothetical protein